MQWQPAAGTRAAASLHRDALFLRLPEAFLLLQEGKARPARKDARARTHTRA